MVEKKGEIETVPGIKVSTLWTRMGLLNLQNKWISALLKWPWVSHSAKLVSGFSVIRGVIILYLMKVLGNLWSIKHLRFSVGGSSLSTKCY